MDKIYRNYYFLLFPIFFIVYFWGGFKHVPFADSIGFLVKIERSQFVPETDCIAHFLFVNFLVLLKNLLHIQNTILLSKIVIILFGSLSIPIIYKIIFEIIDDAFFSLFGAVLFGFAFTFWKNVSLIEVYSFNNFFIALYFYLGIRFLKTKQPKYLVFASSILAISLWVHIQGILLIPGLLILVFLNGFKRSSALSLGIFGLLFIGLFFFPWYYKTPLMWVFSKTQWTSDPQNQTLLNNAKQIGKSIVYLVYNFWFYNIFIISGIVFLFRKNFKIWSFLMVSVVPIFIFATFYFVSDNYVFFLNSYIIIVAFISIGLYSSKSLYKYQLATLVILVPLFYLAVFKIVITTEKGKEFDQFKSYKGGLNFYALPWMNENKGVLEFVIDKKKAPEKVWEEGLAKDYIEIMKVKGYKEEEIKKW